MLYVFSREHQHFAAEVAAAASLNSNILYRQKTKLCASASLRSIETKGSTNASP